MSRRSLVASIKAASPAASPATAEEQAAPPAPQPARMLALSNDGEAAFKAKRAPSREGRKAIYTWVEPAEHLQLKRLSLNTGKTIDALVKEAVQLLFAKHGVKN